MRCHDVLVAGDPKIQGCAWAMVRPTGQFRRYLDNSRVESGRVGRFSKPHLSGRIESGGVQISRVGPGQPHPIRPARSDPAHEKPC